MFLVGLTGGIGSGKSTVAERLVQHGAELIDADEIARHVVLPGTPTWKKLIEHFGSDIVDDAGFIDRAALAAMVFGDPRKRALLNELTHPPVMDEIADRLEVLQALDAMVVLDLPLLVETGVDVGCEAIVVVATTPETQVDRLIAERGMSQDEALARIGAQAPLEDKLAMATHVIWNEGTLEELIAETDRVAEDLLHRAREKADAQARQLPDH